LVDAENSEARKLKGQMEKDKLVLYSNLTIWIYEVVPFKIAS
jgi:hypothetical protein